MEVNNWQQTYISQQLWTNDPFLIVPYITKVLPTTGATKKCRACNKKKFSSEFANCNLFVDKKLPTCNKCVSKRKYNKAAAILNDTGFTKQCNKCGETKPLGSFRVNGSQNGNNDLAKVCQDCVIAAKQRIWQV